MNKRYTGSEERAYAFDTDPGNGQRHYRIPTPLKNSPYKVGRCREYIKQIESKEEREIALSEYFFFSGRSEEAIRLAEKYIENEDISLRYSAYVVYFFANLSRNHIHLARYALEKLEADVRKTLRLQKSHEVHAIGIYTATLISVMMHSTAPINPPLETYIGYLPEGHKLFAYYILAHKAYLQGDYNRSIGIIETALLIHRQTYPIGEIHLHLMAATNHMNIKNIKEAKKHFDKAWELAEPDGLIAPFGQHQRLLQGLVEVSFKNKKPEIFKRINSIAIDFGEGWTKLHNKGNDRQIADNLTTMEFTIAMLYNKGWTMKAIGEYMELSDRTIGNYIQNIYVKLGIKSKKELKEYMLR